MIQTVTKIKRLLKDARGFTLMEMLVVLAIFMTLCSAVFYFAHEKITDYTEKQIMKQMELLIRMTQMMAIEKQNPHIFEVFNCKEVRIWEYRGDSYLFEQKLPEGVELYISTPRSTLQFKTNGNLQQFGTFTYHFDDIKYRYSINIGKGRILDKEVIHDSTRIHACGNATSSRNSILFNIYADSTYLPDEAANSFTKNSSPFSRSRF